MSNLRNTPIGSVFPPATAIPFTPIDARTAGLSALRDYLSELTFQRAGNVGGNPIPFQIPASSMAIEWDDPETDLAIPSIVFEAGEDAQIDDMGFYDETSKDLFGRGTVLFVHAEHIENVTLRITAQNRAERRAILAGLEVALAPVEEIYGMSLLCPNYYNQTVSICPISRRVVDDAQSVLGRRVATVKIDLRINVVQLVNYREIVPYARVNMDPSSL